MSHDLMPQTAQPGECAYCVRRVEPVRLVVAKAKGKRARPQPATCFRCEGALIAGHAPPAAVTCPDCKGTGRMECPACGGDGEEDGEHCGQCNRTGHAPCYDCGGRGMRVAGAAS